MGLLACFVFWADPNAKGAHDFSALVYASGEGHADVVATLLAMPGVAYEQRYGTSHDPWSDASIISPTCRGTRMKGGA